MFKILIFSLFFTSTLWALDSDLINQKKQVLMNKIFSYQKADGRIEGIFETDPSADAIFLVLLKRLEKYDKQIEAESLKKILDWKGHDIFWRDTPNGKPSHDITGIILYCLRDLGLDKNFPELRLSWQWFERNGGEKKFNLASKILLTPIKLIRSDLSTALNVNIFELPGFVPGSIEHQGPMRILSIPLIVWQHYDTLKNGSFLSRLALGSERSAQWGLDWVVKHETGRLYLFYSTYLSLLALKAAEDAGVGKFSYLITRAIDEIKNDRIKKNGHVVLRIMKSAGWDTAHVIISNNFNQTSNQFAKNIENAFQFLLDTQITVPGDWSIVSPKTVPAGWCFDAENVLYPDTDTTAATIDALIGIDHNYPQAKKAIVKGIKWLLDFQNADGGFPSFEKGVSSSFFKLIQTYDANTPDMSDLSQADVTSRILKTLGEIKKTKYANLVPDAVIKNTCKFSIKNHQEGADYIWEGRWFVGYGYGTAEVINGLLTANCINIDDKLTLKSLNYLVSKQNSDGGWGESGASFAAHTYIGSNSTVMQTGYIIQSLQTYEENYLLKYKIHSKFYLNITRAVEYLMKQITDDGTINEKSFSGVVGKGMSFSDYEMDPYFLTLRQLNRYQNLQ